MSSAKTPIKLPPLRVLRVKNPNQREGNPCVQVLSSVLGVCNSSPPGSPLPFLPLFLTLPVPFPLAAMMTGREADRPASVAGEYSMLGLGRLQRDRVRRGRAGAAQLHGRAQAAAQGQEQHQLPPHAHVQEHQPAAAAQVENGAKTDDVFWGMMDAGHIEPVRFARRRKNSCRWIAGCVCVCADMTEEPLWGPMWERLHAIARMLSTHTQRILLDETLFSLRYSFPLQVVYFLD